MGVLALLGLVGMPGVAHAGFCFWSNGSGDQVQNTAPAIVHIVPGGHTINLSANQQSGVLWNSDFANPQPDNRHITCVGGGSVGSGMVNAIGGPPTNAAETLFPSNVPGISYELSHTNSYQTAIQAYPAHPIPANGATYTLQNPTAIQIQYNGSSLPTNGSQLRGTNISGLLTQWKVDMCTGTASNQGPWYNPDWVCNGGISPQPIETIYVGPITFTAPTCSVAPASVNKVVDLPPKPSDAFTGKGSTAGQTGFTLQLTNCHANLDVGVSLGSNNAVADTQGNKTVIASASQPGNGVAQGVGVQILDPNGDPITLNQPLTQSTPVGQTNSGTYNFTLYARYYQTGNTVSAGSVTAIATYTLTYQ